MTTTSCPKCGRPYFYFQERLRYSISAYEYHDLKDPTIVLRSFFERAEEHIVNPLYMGNFQDNYTGNIVLMFIEGILECPYCDKVEVKDQKSKEHYSRINNLIKFLRTI